MDVSVGCLRIAAAQEPEDQEDATGKDADSDCSLHAGLSLLLRPKLERVGDQLVLGPISRRKDLSDRLG